MTARKLSRRATLRGGVAAVALTAGVAVGAAPVAAKADPLLAMNRERLSLRDERRRIEDWCEDMGTKAPESGTMEYLGFDERPVYFWPDLPPAKAIGRRNVSPELQAEYERRIPEMKAQAARRKQWCLENGLVAAEKKADALHDQQWDIQEKMAQTPATSCAGVVVKLRLVLDHGANDLEEPETQLINSAIADLERIGGAS